jgi:hypothetical protein
MDSHLHECISASVHICISTCLFETNRGHLLRLRDLRMELEKAHHTAVAQQCDGHHVVPSAKVQQKKPHAFFAASEDSKRCRAESKRAVCTFDGLAGGMQAAARLVGWSEPFQERRVQPGGRRPSTRACAVIHKCSDS